MKIRLIIATLIALLLPALSFTTVAQDDGARFSVSGTVVDDGGEPLSGAFVMVVGTSNGTTTNTKGQFTINNVSAGDVLEVQFLGFANSRVNAAKGKNVTVAMFPDSNLTLNESVTIAYGSVRRQDLTGSVTNVKMADIKDAPVLSVDQALQGRIAGADIMSTSGEPGAATSIRIRGTRSIIASNEPLIVVDGVPTDDITFVNPDDIAEISVLKDAASSAVYGTRAAFGVVLITTKSGQKGDRVSVKYSNNFGWSNATVLPDYGSVPEQIEALLQKYDCDLNTPVEDIPEEAIDEILNGSNEQLRIPAEKIHTTNDFYTDFEGLARYMEQTAQREDSASARKWVEQFATKKVCPVCHGSRLNKEALCYKINGKNIHELSSMDIKELAKWMSTVEENLSERQKVIGHEIIKEIRKRLEFLLDVGLDYLSLSRASNTLSGGEGQRIRLATQIGSGLVNVLYILDEPSIGLHERDNVRLIKSLKKLRDMGNTVIVVEHDRKMMLSADYVVDLGPKAGRFGGEVVFQGTVKQMLQSETLTAQYLKGDQAIEIPQVRRKIEKGKTIKIVGASGNNLKNIDVEIPLGMLVCVTGVSGSGKSTLINDTLLPILSKKFYGSLREPMPYKEILGVENINKVVNVDQSPVGRTPRSNPATYCGVFSDIRNLFASLPEAKIRGYGAGRFSFNVSGGRCEACKGNGYKTIEMNFMPSVFVPCEECHGKRYNRETLEVRFRGKSISDVLDMTINQAVDFFENIPSILNKIKTLKEVGMGYIKLGQSSTTLSGGESQRVKLASELSKRDTGKTLYILDEPTTGLHFEDIRVLLSVLNRLVGKGNTVVVIEHNLDVVKQADYIIDMGLEGGINGGTVVSVGTPEEIVAKGVGYTAKYLAEELERK